MQKEIEWDKIVEAFRLLADAKDAVKKFEEVASDAEQKLKKGRVEEYAKSKSISPLIGLLLATDYAGERIRHLASVAREIKEENPHALETFAKLSGTSELIDAALSQDPLIDISDLAWKTRKSLDKTIKLPHFIHSEDTDYAVVCEGYRGAIANFSYVVKDVMDVMMKIKSAFNSSRFVKSLQELLSHVDEYELEKQLLDSAAFVGAMFNEKRIERLASEIVSSIRDVSELWDEVEKYPSSVTVKHVIPRSLIKLGKTAIKASENLSLLSHTLERLHETGGVVSLDTLQRVSNTAISLGNYVERIYFYNKDNEKFTCYAVSTEQPSKLAKSATDAVSVAETEIKSQYSIEGACVTEPGSKLPEQVEEFCKASGSVISNITGKYEYPLGFAKGTTIHMSLPISKTRSGECRLTLDNIMLSFSCKDHDAFKIYSKYIKEAVGSGCNFKKYLGIVYGLTCTIGDDIPAKAKKVGEEVARTAVWLGGLYKKK
ncbi:MAG: hypothetical protein ACP5IE_00245 [Infirmifilum sp.]